MIANSLSITIAQRTREFATLRTLGASRRQVLRSILVESLAVGVDRLGGRAAAPGSALAQGLFALFNAAGLTLPNSGTVVEAADDHRLDPGRRRGHRARQPAPGAARHPGRADRRRPRGRDAARRAVGQVPHRGLGRDGRCSASSPLLLGLFVASGTGAVLALMGLGAMLVFIGVALLSARIVPRAGDAGSAGRRRGSPAPSARLARDNARRNPQRTASTASALMIGLALVTLVAMLSAGIIANFQGAVNDLFTGDYAITAQNNFSPSRSRPARPRSRAPGVDRGRRRPRRPGPGVRLQRAADRGRPRRRRR